MKPFALFFFANAMAYLIVDTLGLFGAEADDSEFVPNAKRQKTGEDTSHRRNTLFPLDTVASQTFKMSVKDTWAAAST